MGGFGSGRRRTVNRGDIEDALVVDLRVLRRHGLLRPLQVTAGTLSASGAKGGRFQARCVVDLTDPAIGALRVTTDIWGAPVKEAAVRGRPSEPASLASSE